MTRPTYVYRLNVAWPECTPRLVPYCRCATCDNYDRTGAWPRVRNYLSERGAAERAWLLEHLGAAVEVQRSARVEWNVVEQETTSNGGTS